MVASDDIIQNAFIVFGGYVDEASLRAAQQKVKQTIGQMASDVQKVAADFAKGFAPTSGNADLDKLFSFQAKRIQQTKEQMESLGKTIAQFEGKLTQLNELEDKATASWGTKKKANFQQTRNALIDSIPTRELQARIEQLTRQAEDVKRIEARLQTPGEIIGPNTMLRYRRTAYESNPVTGERQRRDFDVELQDLQDQYNKREQLEARFYRYFKQFKDNLTESEMSMWQQLSREARGGVAEYSAVLRGLENNLSRFTAEQKRLYQQLNAEPTKPVRNLRNTLGAIRSQNEFRNPSLGEEPAIYDTKAYNELQALAKNYYKVESDITDEAVKQQMLYGQMPPSIEASLKLLGEVKAELDEQLQIASQQAANRVLTLEDIKKQVAAEKELAKTQKELAQTDAKIAQMQEKASRTARSVSYNEPIMGERVPTASQIRSMAEQAQDAQAAIEKLQKEVRDEGDAESEAAKAKNQQIEALKELKARILSTAESWEALRDAMKDQQSSTGFTRVLNQAKQLAGALKALQDANELKNPRLGGATALYDQSAVSSMIRLRERLLTIERAIDAEAQKQSATFGEVPPQIKDALDLLGKVKSELQSQIALGTQQLSNTRLNEEERRKQLAVEKELAQTDAKIAQMQEKFSRTNTSVQENKPTQGLQVATYSQIKSLTAQARDAEIAIAKLNKEIKDEGDAESLSSRRKTEQVEQLKKLRSGILDTRNAYAQLRKEVDSQSSNGFINSIIRGLQSEGVDGAIRSLKTKLQSAINMNGGGVTGVAKAAQGALGFGLITAPLNIVSGLSRGLMSAGMAFQNFYYNVSSGFGILENFIQQAGTMREETVQFALQMGISIDKAQGVVGLFQALGLDTRWTAVGLQALNKEVIKNNAAFTSMGIATRDAKGNVRDVLDVIEDFRNKYHSLDAAGKTNFIGNISTALPFSSMFLPLITADYDKLQTTLVKLNVVLNDTKKSSALTDVAASMQTIKMAGQGLANTITVALAPAIKEFANDITNFLIQHMGQIESFFSKISSEVRDFLHFLSGAGKSLDIVNDVRQVLTAGEQQGASQLDVYQNQLDGANDAASALQDQVSDLNDTLSDQQDILSGLQDTMQGQLDAIEAQKTAITDALESQSRPLEDVNTKLERQIDLWNEEKQVATESIDKQLQALQQLNSAIDSEAKNNEQPLKDRLTVIGQQKNVISHQKDFELAKLGNEPDKADTTALENRSKYIEKEIKAIQDDGEAWKELQQAQIDSIQVVADAIDQQIQGIQDAEDAWNKQQEAAKDAIQTQIKGIQDVMKASQEQAQSQQYYDQRAYLMGQTLLAQAEARVAALSDRQSRQRNSGENDVDYQLRIQQLNAQNDVTSIKKQQDIKDFDQAHALDMANAAYQKQIDLLQAQSDAIDEQVKARKTADQAVLDGLNAQKKAYEDQMDAIKKTMDLRDKSDQAAIKGLQTQDDNIKDNINALKDAADANRKAWEDAKQAITDAADAATNALDKEGEDVQAQIDAIQNQADKLTQINSDTMDSLNKQKQAISDYYDSLITPMQRIVDANKRILDDLNTAAQRQIQDLELAKKAVHALYDPQIDAQKDVIKGLQGQIKDLNAQIKQIQKDAKATQELISKAQNSANNDESSNGTNDPYSSGSIGGRLGRTVFKDVIGPFYDMTHGLSQGEHRMGGSTTMDESYTPSFGTALGQMFDRSWDDIKPQAAKLVDKIMDTITSEISKWITDHPATFIGLNLMLIMAIFIPGGILIDIGLLMLVPYIKKLEKWITDNPLKFAAIAWDILMFMFGGGFTGATLGLLVLWPLIKKLGIWIGQNASKLWDIGKSFFKEFLEGGAKLFAGLFDWLVGAIITPIKSFVKEWGKLTDTWMDFWREMLTAGAKLFEDIGKWLYDHVIKPLVSFLVSAVKTGAELYVAYLKMWLTILELGAEVLKDIGKWLYDHVAKPIINFFGDAVKTGGDIAKAALGFFGGILDVGVDAFKDIGSWLVKHIGDPIVNFFKGLPDAVGDVFGTFVSKVMSPFNTIKHGIHTIFNSIAGIVNSVANFVGLSDLIKVPTEDADFTYVPSAHSDIGLVTGGHALGYQGLAKGTDFWKGGTVWVGEKGPELVDLPRGSKVYPHDKSMQMGRGGPDVPGAGNVVGAITGAFDWAKNTAESVGKHIVDAPGDLMGLAKDVAIATMKKALNGVVDNVPGLDSIRNTVLWTLVKGIGSKVISAAGDWFGGAKDKYDASNILDLDKLFPSGLTAPSQSYGRTTFSEEINPATGTTWEPNGFHHGVDIFSVDGSTIPIYAPGSGKIISEIAGYAGYGNWLGMALQSAGKTIDVYLAHLDHFVAKLGDSIKKGDLLGFMGTTGHSTGVHTHIEVYENGVEVNPEKYFPDDAWYWGSDAAADAGRASAGLAQFKFGGLIKPNTTLLDAMGRPYATAGEPGNLEAVTPVDFLKGIVRQSITNASMKLDVPTTMVRPTGPLMGDIIVNTAATSPEGIAEAVRDAAQGVLTDFLGELPAHAASTAMKGVR